ncbi:futalosine hydrolase [Candidatus Poribacteria bacterium]|nr:MAG: futalosine hydrolase [Candidatus Poribacteria bacterium]
MAQSNLLLVSATEIESATIQTALGNAKTTQHAGKAVTVGNLCDWRCTLLHTGIGSVNAAHALTCQLEGQLPDLVIQFGIGGAYVPTGLPIQSVALATEEIYGDVGVLTPEGWKPADEIGIPLVHRDPPYFNRFPLDSRLVSTAAEMCGAQCGPFVTVSQCSGVQAVGDALHARFNALCESMEGAAAAHICTLYDVPFLEVRGISNLVEDRQPDRWDIPGAAEAAQSALIKIISDKKIMRNM